MINVWASWCLPCRLEMPSLERLNEKLGSEQFSVIAISIDEQVHQIREFVHRYEIDLPIALDPGAQSVGKLFAVDRFPATLIIDRDGIIAERIDGQREWDEPEMVEKIRQLAVGDGSLP